ncbi:MAG: septum site-determining protein MinD [Clostridiaceae bacterium]|jgi:septum site-determining protein MinD|nr:septum site-determining protein MinD [Clostridiaceae bacterium]
MAARKIVITSGKGGVGKTTVTAGLGYALAAAGFGVILVDADVGLNNLDVALGVEDRKLYDFSDILESRCRPGQALIRCGERDLFVLSSGAETPAMTAQAFRGVIESLATSCDFIFIDCPAGIENGFHRAVSAADEAVVVTNPAVSAIRDADKVLSLLTGYTLSSVGIAINRINGGKVLSGEMMSAADIARLLRRPTLGIIPEDAEILLGKTPAHNGRSEADEAFGAFADNIASRRARPYDYLSAHRGFRGFFRRRA